MKRNVIIALAFLVLSLGVGGFFAYKHWAAPGYAGPDKSLIAAEEALAAPNTLLLASFDIAYLRSLDRKLNGTPHLPDLVTPDADADEESTTVLDQIRRTLAKEYDDLKFVTMGVYLTKESGPSIVIVSGGNLRQEKALAFLKNNPNARPAPNLPNTWIVQGEDPNTCKLSKPWTIVIDSGRIIATDARDTRIIDRVRGGSSAGRDLTLWREFRKERFASAALFLPESLPNEGIDPMTYAIASKAQKQLIDFDALYLGASATPLPPKGKFALYMEAKSPAIAEQKATEWKTSLADSRKNWETTLPTLAAIHDRAHISARENLVLVDVEFDQKLGGQLRNLGGEFIGLLFKGFEMKQITDTGGQVREVVDKNPLHFKETISPDDIRPYDPKTTFAEEAEVTSGPFGIYVSAARMTQTEPRTTELEIAAKGTGLPNLVDGREDAVDLIVASVKDREGRELLRPERCGPDRNGRPAKGHKIYGFPVVEVKKTVRLRETAGVRDVARIEGALRTQLPSHVEAVTLKGPKPGDHFDRDKTRIEVMRVGNNGISYRVSGDTSRLLLVRGKNAKGEILSGRGRSSTRVPGGAMSASDNFQGTAAEVEFIIAREIDEKVFPFTLANSFPRATGQSTRREPVSFSRYPRSEFKRDLAKPIVVNRFSKPVSMATAGPIVVDLDQMMSFFNLGMNLSVSVPLIKNAEQSLTAVELEIDSVKLADGKVERPEKEKPWRVFVPMSRSGQHPYVRGSARIETAIKGVKPENVRSLAGHVTLHVAEVPKSTLIDGTVLGKSQDSPCGPVMVSELSRSRMRLEGRGNEECVYGVRVLSGGQDLYVNDQAIRQTEGGWTVELGMSGQAERVEFVTASKKHTIRYPFTLKTAAAVPNNPQHVRQ